MKTKLLFIGMLLWGVSMLGQEKNCSGCGQSNLVEPCVKTITQDIEVDFKCRSTLCLPKNLKIGDFYRIRVKNINTNIYKVVINSKDTILTNPLADIPLFKDISLDVLTKKMESFKESVSATYDVNTVTLKPKSMTNLELKNFKNDEQELENKLDEIKSSLETSTQDLINFKTRYDAEKMKLYVYRLKKQSQDNTYSEYDFEQALKIFESLRADLIHQTDNLSIIDANFQDVKSDKKYKDVITIKNIKESIVSLKGTIAEINTKISDFQEQTNADNVEKIVRSILYLTNCTEYVSLPIQFTKEQAKVSIQFEPKDPASGLQVEKMAPFYFPLSSKSYWSIGSSFYFGFNLANERFSSIATTDASNNKTYKLVKEDEAKNEIGIASILRYGRDYKYFGFHGSFGPGVSIEKSSKPRMLLGFGFSFGNKHCLAIDGGLIAGYVDKKSNAIDLDKSYSEIPETTITKLALGEYISLGYLYKF